MKIKMTIIPDCIHQEGHSNNSFTPNLRIILSDIEAPDKVQ